MLLSTLMTAEMRWMQFVTWMVNMAGGSSFPITLEVVAAAAVVVAVVVVVNVVVEVLT